MISDTVHTRQTFILSFEMFVYNVRDHSSSYTKCLREVINNILLLIKFRTSDYEFSERIAGIINKLEGSD